MIKPGDNDYDKLQRIFLDALELQDAGAREAFLDRSCAGEAGLREAVQALFLEHAETGRSGSTILATNGGEASGPEDPQSSAFVPGRVLVDRYRIVSLLGKGGMGEVYRADDLKLEQPVALKFLPSALEQDQALLKALYNEVRAARRVSHRHVCRVYDIGEAEGMHFLTMEYIEGEDLGSLLHRIGRLPSDKAIELIRQLCSGLQAAHEEGLLHLDLKPGNLMIDREGVLRITDFGLARLSRDAASETKRAGTPAYMAPEQLLEGKASVLSDLYAVGLVMYAMVTGRRVHNTNSPVEIARWYESGSIPDPPSRTVADLDREVERVILHLLESDPVKRPASANAVLERLKVTAPMDFLTADELEKSDVYISFAAVDDQALSPEHEGWISQLQRDLEVRIQQLSGTPVRVCKLNKHTPGRDEPVQRVLEYLPTVKTLVSVVSPPFVQATGCLQEVEAFWSAADREHNISVGGTTRILKAIKAPVESDIVPPRLQRAFDSASGFEFYDHDPETGRVREYDEALGSRARQYYYQCLYDLAHDVNLVLKSYRPGEAGEKASAVSSDEDGKTVYLAETTSDLRSERDRLKRELVERGHRVLPDRALPMEQPELETTVRGWLQEAELALHPVGCRYGWVPEGEERSFVELQNKWAAEHSREFGLPRLVWVPNVAEVEDGRQAEVIRGMQEEPSMRIGAEVFGGRVNAFKDLMLQRLIPSADQNEPAMERGGGDEPRPIQVYLIADPNDEERIAELEDYLFEQGMEVCLPDFESMDEEEIAAAHRENLCECDGVIVYYGDVRRTWVETKLRELLKASGFGRRAPFLSKTVYLAPPFDARKDRFKTHLADLVRQPGSFDPAELQSLVAHLKSQPLPHS